MDARRWVLVETLYHAALAKEPRDRSSYVAAACVNDPSLQAEVESLLGYVDATLVSPSQPSELKKLWDQVAGSSRRQLSTPATLGRYRIIRLLGEGGMGAVYEAEQEQPRRTVALKIIKPGLAGPQSLRRFELECEALARLQHPGIAQIYEAGTADTGFGPQPYFAMEFVRGQSLLEYANSRELNTRQKLELIAKICEAVQHAHQRGIIHRDLKPGNILVDENGQPKILDFGVARVADSYSQATRQTDLGQLVGTLEYMSPEQVHADPRELDTRSDVYSLGVILFELLAGRLPYNIGRQLVEAARTIREQDPTPLSSIDRAYRGDLETIAAKALEKDKARRYASAAELVGDIQRYLKNEPITARPPSAMYQLQKFVLRHKTLVAAAIAIFAVLIAGVVISSWQAARARRAEQAALRERNLVLLNMYDRNRGQAEALLIKTLEIQKRALGETNPETLDTMNELANLYRSQYKYAQADPLFAKVLAGQRRLLGDTNSQTLQTMEALAYVYQNESKYAESELLLNSVLEARRRTLGEAHHQTQQAMSELTQLYVAEGKYQLAEPIYASALESSRRFLGDESPATLNWMDELAGLYRQEGKYTDAERLYTTLLDVRHRTAGEHDPTTLYNMNELTRLYLDERKLLQADALLREAMNALNTDPGLGFQADAKHVRSLSAHYEGLLHETEELARLYLGQGKYALAESLLRQGLETEQTVKALSGGYPRTAHQNLLRQALEAQRKSTRAKP